MRIWFVAVALALASSAALAAEAGNGDASDQGDETESSADDRQGTPKAAKEETVSDAGEAEAEVSLEDATAIVRQAYGGRVVSSSGADARPEPKRPDEPGYRVRVDVDGRVKTVFVDKRGRIHENAEF